MKNILIYLLNRRNLLLISVVLFILPIVVKQLLNMILLFTVYFFAFYFILINFPDISSVLYSKPIYIDDLVDINIENKKDYTFKRIYTSSINIIISIVFSIFVVYCILIKDINHKTIIEVLGIIGGLQSLFMKIQNIIGTLLLNICQLIKNKYKISSPKIEPEIPLEIQSEIEINV